MNKHLENDYIHIVKIYLIVKITIQIVDHCTRNMEIFQNMAFTSVLKQNTATLKSIYLLGPFPHQTGKQTSLCFHDC